MTFPLSAVLTYSLTSPAISILSVLKIALTEALPDERYWQSRHQHARVAIGGWLHWNRTAPQKHLPVMGFGILDTLRSIAAAETAQATVNRTMEAPIPASSAHNLRRPMQPALGEFQPRHRRRDPQRRRRREQDDLLPRPAKPQEQAS